MNRMNIGGIIKGLKCISGDAVKCKTCEYYEGGLGCRSKICVDAIKLLQKLPKEPEPVKPKQKNPHVAAWWYECGNCDSTISPSDNYCRGCGRMINWSK